jgi:hypothetical protein
MHKQCLGAGAFRGRINFFVGAGAAAYSKSGSQPLGLGVQIFKDKKDPKRFMAFSLPP